MSSALHPFPIVIVDAGNTIDELKNNRTKMCQIFFICQLNTNMSSISTAKMISSGDMKF